MSGCIGSRIARDVGVLLGASLLLAACGTGGARSIGPFLEDTLPAGSSGTLVAAGRDRMVYCKGFGAADREADVPATCDTVYDIMSMTKQFTAAAVLKLQMLGRLEVTDRIGEYFHGVPADKRAITVQELLTQTSGLVDSLGGDYQPLSRREMVTRALATKLLAPPGAEYHYSNVGYSLLAAIVEEASGTGYEQFLAKNLFGPAGMTSTGYVLPHWPRRQVAVEYDAHGRPHGRPYEHPWADDGPYWNLRGNGGLLSTARDMFRWHRALEGEKILDRPAKKELFEPRVREEPDGDTYYAYGWVMTQSDDGPVAWHNGGNDCSYGEVTRVLETGAMVFWVTNHARSDAGGWDFYELGEQISQGVAERLRAPD